MGIFLKLASEETATTTGIPSTELVFFRSTFQGSLVVIGMIGSRQRENGRLLIANPFGQSIREIKVVVARGVIGGIGFLFYFYSIKTLPLGDAITLFSLYPILTIFLARCVLNEPISIYQLCAAVACVIGATLIAGPSFLQYDDTTAAGTGMLLPSSSDTCNPLGYLTALLGSFFGASVIVLVRKAGKLGVHTLQLLFSWATCGILFSLLFGFSAVGQRLEGPWYIPQSNTEWWYILGMCSTGSVAHFLMNYAIRLGPAGLSAIARSSDLVWAYVWQVILFHRVPTDLTIMGVVLIVIALGGIAVQKVGEERRRKDELDCDGGGGGGGKKEKGEYEAFVLTVEKGDATETTLLLPGDNHS